MIMASKISKSCILQVVKRSYSAKASPQAIAAPDGLQVTKLPSGALVASLENNSPLARVAIFLRAGSRYDTVPGISYFLRSAASWGMSSNQRTGFNLIRVKEQVGARVCVSTDKELAVYSIVSNRDSVGESLSLLSSMSSNNSYKYYEFSNPKYNASISHALGQLGVEERVLDLASKAAFRAQALGNSIFLPQYNFGKISAEQLNVFVEATHGSAGLVVVGTGMDHEVLVAGASAMGVAGGSVQQGGMAGTKYFGGDLRVETGSSSVCVAVLGEGAKLGSSDLLACRVAASLLSSGPCVKYGGNASSALTRALDGTEANVRGVALGYTDAGLLGFVLHTSAKDAPKVVSSITSSIKNLTASDRDVAGAKARVKAALLEEGVGCCEVGFIGCQMLLTGNYVAVSEAIRAVDAVTPAAVTKAIAKAFSGKLTVAAIGGVKDLPYSDIL